MGRWPHAGACVRRGRYSITYTTTARTKSAPFHATVRLHFTKRRTPFHLTHAQACISRRASGIWAEIPRNARTCSVLPQQLWRAARHDKVVGMGAHRPSGRVCHFDRSGEISRATLQIHSHRNSDIISVSPYSQKYLSVDRQIFYLLKV